MLGPSDVAASPAANWKRIGKTPVNHRGFSFGRSYHNMLRFCEPGLSSRTPGCSGFTNDKTLYREQNEREVEMWPWIEPANFVVQLVIAAGLIWYTCETWKIRKASQEQIATSQEQNEIMQKPCLVPLVKERGGLSIERDVLKDHPYPEQRVLNPSVAGSVRLRNIGNGPAFNIRYEAQLQEQEGCRKGALPYIAKGETESTYLSASISNEGRGAVRLKLSYESLSGRSYESEMSIKEWDAVVTCYQFR